MRRSMLSTMSLLAITGAALVATPHASAAEVSTATCFVAGSEMALAPGIGLVPSQQHIRDRGMSITCTGQLGDRHLDPSRSGIWDVDVTTGTRPGPGGTGTCLTDAGEGHIAVHLPTADGGTLELDGPATYIAAGPGTVLQGDLGRYHFRSIALSVPDLSHPEGNCFTAPLQHWLSAGPLMLFDNTQ
ncbi:hypothetical protein [Nocardia sp. NPDC006630]|uniref:hypothetical protein n=1 Tax=Nocardia sp. NPDC006630 TaxID=3157181 RepID=UPI0033AD58E5